MARSLTPDTRVEQAEWYSAALSGFSGRVECVVPRGYPAYARILHPAQGLRGHRVAWSEVAAHTGRVLHPLAQFTSLAGRWQYDERSGVGWPGENPAPGTLDVDQLRVLCRILSSHTATRDHCWLTVWDGWGNLPSDWTRTAPRVRQPGRAYFLFERRLDEVVDLAVDLQSLAGDSPSFSFLTSATTRPAQASVTPPSPGELPTEVRSPSQWWPEDRAWCVATEIDFDSTLVGGSESLVEQITTDPHLEAFAVMAEDDLTYRGDTINPSPLG